MISMKTLIKTMLHSMMLTITFLMFASWNVYAQQGITVTGTVTDAGDPLPGVTVLVKGTLTGSATGPDGKFSISVPNTNAVLVFSYIGYTTQEVAVGNRRVIDVVLEEDSKALQEVVVVGYGTQRKSDVTGAVVSVKGKELTYMPTNRVDQALQGRAAGVYIQNFESAPGGRVGVNIRGINSWTGGNDVLIVVDGVQGLDLTNLNPNDIESMEVLKDASATAIYGARGANGVILITTKRGQSGKPTISYDYDFGAQRLGEKIPLLNAYEYAVLNNEAALCYDRDATGNPITPYVPYPQSYLDKFKNGQNGTDWQDEVFRTGILQTHQLSISGGNDAVKYFISGGFLDQKGIMINTNFQRINVRANFDVKITNWLRSGINLGIIRTEGNVPPLYNGSGGGTAFYNYILPTIVMMDPCTSVYDENGEYNYYMNSFVPGTPEEALLNEWSWSMNFNPVALAKENFYWNKGLQQMVNAYLEADVLPGLKFRTSLAANATNNSSIYYYSRKTAQGRGSNGMGAHSMAQNVFFQNSNQLTYDLTVKNHRLNVVAVGEQQYWYNESLNSGEGTQFSTDEVGVFNLTLAGTRGLSTNGFSKRTLNSWLGRINYVFKDRYMVTLSGRADGSSVFGANNKWGYFPAGALGWDMAKESFMQGFKNVISTWKWRGSWGQTGNQAIGAYTTLAQVAFNVGNYPYFTGDGINAGSRITRVPNSNLKWETTTQTDLGIDLGFFHQRLNISFDWYKKITSDVLFNTTFPGYVAMSGGMMQNIGKFENKGLEMTIDATPVSNKDFHWNTRINISGNRNKILELLDHRTVFMAAGEIGLGGGLGVSDAATYALKQLREGESIHNLYGWVFEGYWRTTEREQAAQYWQYVGEERYKEHPDENGNMTGKITPVKDGNIILGNAAPKFFFGWTNNISYKNFELSFLFQGTYGNSLYNATRRRLEEKNYGSPTRAWLNRWTPENQDNPSVQRWIKESERQAERTIFGTVRNFQQWAHTGRIGGGYLNAPSSKHVEDASYLRLKNISLTYRLPKSLIKPINANNIAFTFSATNIFTITKYSGWDPEVSTINVTPASSGIDFMTYPYSRVYTLAVNLTF